MKTIELNGILCVTTKTAAERLSVSERRVLQFLEEKRLQSIQIESGGPHYITVESLDGLAKIERLPGRPKSGAKERPKPEPPSNHSAKSKSKDTAKSATKKSSKK